MKRAMIALLLMILCSNSMLTRSMISALDFSTIDDMVLAEMKRGRIPGLALGIIQGNEIAHLRGYGTTGLGYDVEIETPFFIGSLTKTFTALAMLQLEEKNIIDLDRPINTYLPWFQMEDRRASFITARHLLNQTSGIAGSEDRLLLVPLESETLESQAKKAQKLPLATAPGATMSYSNWNYVLLGALLQEVLGNSYGEYIEQHIFKPLGMENRLPSSSDKDEAFLAGYQWVFGFPIKTIDSLRGDLISAGYLSASALDMSRFLMSINRDEEWALGIQGALQELPEDKRDGEHYGMGWGLKVVGGRPILFHEGMTPAHYAVMIIEPEEGLALALLSNASSLYTPKAAGALAWNIMSALLEEPLIGQANAFWRFYGIIYGAALILLILCSWILLSLGKWQQKHLTSYQGGALSFVKIILLPLLGDLLFPFIALIMIPSGSGFPFWRAMWEWQKDLSFLGVSFAVFMVVIFLLRFFKAITYVFYSKQHST